MPTIVGILTLMGRINVVLSCGDDVKSFIASGPGQEIPQSRCRQTREEETQNTKSQDIRKTTKVKQPALFLVKMIANLERTLSTA